MARTEALGKVRGGDSAGDVGQVEAIGTPEGAGKAQRSGEVGGAGQGAGEDTGDQAEGRAGEEAEP
ncbi:hypothetical protein [Spongiactinospora sp. 9N601]|uniref:hypothetical protein n=1 Tax=Spongiactinospora sp. 9N601 TaxID=3375149 RepID=UPI0037A4EBED